MKGCNNLDLFSFNFSKISPRDYKIWKNLQTFQFIVIRHKVLLSRMNMLVKWLFSIDFSVEQTREGLFPALSRYRRIITADSITHAHWWMKCISVNSGAPVSDIIMHSTGNSPAAVWKRWASTESHRTKGMNRFSLSSLTQAYTHDLSITRALANYRRCMVSAS